MLSYSWGMTSNKCGCEAQTPSLVPPIEASPLLIYSHFGRPDGGSETLAEQKVGRRVRDPRRTKGRTAGQRPSPNKRSDGGSETLVEQKVGRRGQRPSPNKHSEILYRIPTALPRNCRYNTYIEPGVRLDRSKSWTPNESRWTHVTHTSRTDRKGAAGPYDAR